MIHVLRPPLGGDSPLPVTHHTPVVDLRAMGDQELHHLRLLLRGGPHQRRLAAPQLPGIDLGAMTQQQRLADSMLPERATTISGVSPSALDSLAFAPAFSNALITTGSATVAACRNTEAP